MAKPIRTPKQNLPTTPKPSTHFPVPGTVTGRFTSTYPPEKQTLPPTPAVQPDLLRPGHLAPNHRTMNEWSFGTKLTVFQMPIAGVVWAPDLVGKVPGANHQTPMLAMRAVFVKDSIYLAFGTGPDAPTRLTMRVPRGALLTLLAKAASMDMENQETKTYYLDETGGLLDAEESDDVPAFMQGSKP